jgi:acetyltransferase
LARNAQEAAQIAEQAGFPVALKIAAENITHKSEVGGVLLNIKNPQEATQGFLNIYERVTAANPDVDIEGVYIQPMAPAGQEVIIGAVRDEQFGPLIMFGAGGVEVEGRRDVAFGLAPLSRAEAEKLIEATFAGRRLRGFRGSAPVNREAVIDRVLRVAQFICDFPQVVEVEINPLRVLSDGALAIDVRIRVVSAE